MPQSPRNVIVPQSPRNVIHEKDTTDLALSVSFHLDHCGALPWFLQKTSFKGRTFMTHATKAIYRWLLSDYVKVRCVTALRQTPVCCTCVSSFTFYL